MGYLRPCYWCADMQRRHLADPEFAYLRPATSCKKAGGKWCAVSTFKRCDAAAKLAKLADTYAKDAHRVDRPPGCYFDTQTDTLFYNLNRNQNHPGGSRFRILCELCHKTREFCFVLNFPRYQRVQEERDRV